MKQEIKEIYQGDYKNDYVHGFEYDLEDLNVPTELLSHENDGGLLLKEFDSIDILLTGHQHRIIAQKVN